MLKVVTAKEMQDIDRKTIASYGIPGIVLMERAGVSVVNRINSILFPSGESSFGARSKVEVIVFCGGGNNGGDGFVIARCLCNQGYEVEVYMSVKPGDLKGDAKTNYISAKKFGVKMWPIKNFLERPPGKNRGKVIFVDALLGTGLSSEVRAPLTDVITGLNEMNFPVVSVDIPSGISSDSGQVMGCAVRAQYTVTFGLPKRGHYLYPGSDHAGQLFIEDIGFPYALLNSSKININLIQERDVESYIPERPEYSHKGSFGHVLIIAGSKGKTGAALMAARACLKTGAGLVTIGIPETLVGAFQKRVTEEMILPLPDKGDGTLASQALADIFNFSERKADVIAVGPGLSSDSEIAEIIETLIKQCNKPLIIDADGLNVIAGRTNVLKKSRVPVVLTPHIGEMARLLKGSTKYINKDTLEIKKCIVMDKINIAALFAKKTGAFLVLKGTPTLTATPDGEVYLNRTGNSGMASAGTGDVLTGMISSFLAQGLSACNASVAGVYTHGLAGNRASEKKGKRSMVASDIIGNIPPVLKALCSGNC